MRGRAWEGKGERFWVWRLNFIHPPENNERVVENMTDAVADVNVVTRTHITNT